MNELNEIISHCMLFTISLFSIPTLLQLYYNIFPLFIVTPVQLLFGIYYHTHFILTNGNPFTIIKMSDIIISITSSVLIIIYGINSPTTLIIASGVPIFYILSLLVFNNKIKHKILGASKLHSLVHISAISASSFIVFYINDEYKILFDTILILSGFFIGILIFFISMKYLKYNNEIFQL